jgi:hypothetical protein
MFNTAESAPHPPTASAVYGGRGEQEGGDSTQELELVTLTLTLTHQPVTRHHHHPHQITTTHIITPIPTAHSTLTTHP